jgi:DNA-binding CsgD family transcriptional regulator
MRSRLELVRGELDAAERQLREGRRAYDRTVGSMWLGPLFGSMANLALQRGEVTEVRRVVAEAREAMDDEYAFYCDELYLAGLSGEADAAERARALGDADGEREALERGGDLLERLRELTDPGRWGGSPPPQVAADLAVGEAEGLRLRGEPSAAAWKAAEDLLDDLGNVLAASYVRLRRAEALLDSEGDRAGAAEALRRAHADTSEVGATRLRSAAQTLARRARIELGEETGTAAEDRPLGLTERELEVLLLVADGKTNRQIGAELYMSEKTASVHVSRILAKLEVSTRGEAAAVAHRLGLAGA